MRGNSSNSILAAISDRMALPAAGRPRKNRASITFSSMKMDVRSSTDCPGSAMVMMPLLPVPRLPPLNLAHCS